MILLFALLLQAPPPAPQPGSVVSPTSFDRIRREIQRDAIRFDLPAPDVPVFRVHVRERSMPFSVLWQERARRPSYVRPHQPISHYEFLLQVTPEEFRASTLYPCCVKVLPAVGFVKDRIAHAARARAEKRAKQKVEKELQALRAGGRS